MSGVIFVIAACLLWSLDTLFRYPLLGEGISAERIVFHEHLFLTLIFIPFLYKNRSRIWLSQVNHIFYFAIIGGLGSAVGTLAFTKAFSLISPSLVILLQKLQPLVAIILAKVLLKEELQSKFIFWALLCLVGGGLISYDDILPIFFFEGDLLGSTAFQGYALTLLAVVSWGAATVFGKKLSLEGYSETEIMSGRFLMGFIFLIPLLATGQITFLTQTIVVGKVLIMVAVSGLLGMFLYYKGLKKLPARLCALAEMFFPFCAITVNWIFLNQALSPMEMIGGGLLLLGSTVIQLKHY
jgi:drug/metabolite transporter (DMT)-like permease